VSGRAEVEPSAELLKEMAHVTKSASHIALADQANVEPGDLPLKDTRGAFEYACQFMKWPPVEVCEEMLAIVEDAREIAGAQQAIKVDDDGNQTEIVSYCGGTGTATGIGMTISQRGPRLVPGQLVVWQATKAQPNLQKEFAIGMILATLHPVWSPKIARVGAWVGDEQFA
jgi:hypothetical protein